MCVHACVCTQVPEGVVGGDLLGVFQQQTQLVGDEGPLRRRHHHLHRHTDVMLSE